MSPEPADRAFLLLQYLLPRTLLTRLAGWFARREARWLATPLIRLFVRAFDVDMREATNPDPAAYASFNAFFTRALAPGVRSWPKEAGSIASPCDGAVSEFGALDGRRMLQAKGQQYSVDDLLADPALGERYRDGSFATLYLSPKDYHRVHMPQAGVLEHLVYVPGGLYSVNERTVATRRGLFARNERVVCTFRGVDGEPGFAMVLVGALIVGGIRTTWAGRITPRTAEPWRSTSEARVAFEQGDEMGCFELGSTVILLYPGGTAGWDLAPGAPVRLGAPIGRLLGRPDPAAG